MTTNCYRGVAFEVRPNAPFPGIGWRIRVYDHLGREVRGHESQGAYYEGEPDHPEGAYAWADAACRRFIDQLLAPCPCTKMVSDRAKRCSQCGLPIAQAPVTTWNRLQAKIRNMFRRG